MIIVKVMGGLGNQLQQYAVYQKFLTIHKEARLDLSWFDETVQKKQLMPRKLELTLFCDLPYEVCTREEKEGLLGQNTMKDRLLRRVLPARYAYFAEEGRMYLPEIFSLQKGYLEGYWACEAYYRDILPLLRDKLRFPDSANPRNAQAAEQMEQENSVSVHLRRGDYLDASNAALFGGICTAQYYERAMAYIRERMENPHFYIFSDDAAYAARQYAGGEFTVVDWNQKEKSFYDMYLMSCCKHNICANSTFSFWGARLNRHPDKIMIRPLKHRNNQIYEREQMEQLWQDWILME